jgi:hypothetical protein
MTHRLDLLFVPEERPVGIWLNTIHPSEAHEQALITALMRVSGATGIYVADLEQPRDAEVAYLRTPSVDDWSEFRDEWVPKLLYPWLESDQGDWCIVWSDEGFLLCGAAPHLVEEFRTIFNRTLDPMGERDVREIAARWRTRSALRLLEVKHYGSAITWAFPPGHPVRDAWDHDPFIRQVTAGLTSWD